MRTRLRRTIACSAIAATAAIGVAGTSASAETGPTFPPRTEECKVPTALFPVAALVDVDSLEGCGYFEDPNFFENRKANGTYNPNGVFSTLFG